jgi:hypothetical protein
MLPEYAATQNADSSVRIVADPSLKYSKPQPVLCLLPLLAIFFYKAMCRWGTQQSRENSAVRSSSYTTKRS